LNAILCYLCFLLLMELAVMLSESVEPTDNPLQKQ
jgi:hypothetical protein